MASDKLLSYDHANVDAHQKERIRNIENGVMFTGREINQSLFSKVNNTAV